MSDLNTAMALSLKIENMLVERNLRGMKTIQNALPQGYILRAAKLMKTVQGTVLIGTGFPVMDTFETDGPVGAIALYQACENLGAKPVLVCGAPLSKVLAKHYRVHEIAVGQADQCAVETQQALNRLQPELVISIERPGLASDGKYYNMRGEDISARAACFDGFLNHSHCPSIAIGDGGNEIGMGNIQDALQSLDIRAAVTGCSELIIADVSNWAALGLIAMLDWLTGKSMLAKLDTMSVLDFLSQHNSVDGVTRENTLTEDGLPAQKGMDLLNRLQAIIATSKH